MKIKVYVAEYQYDYEGSALVGVTTTLDEAKKMSDNSGYGDMQTICLFEGSNGSPKLVATMLYKRDRLDYSGSTRFSDWRVEVL